MENLDWDFERNISAPDTLTVIIADESRLIHAQEPVTHRSVSIRLTQKQRDQLSLKLTGSSGPVAHYERISMCFLEDDKPKTRKAGE